MRIVFAAVIWVVLVGGLALFLGTRQAPPTVRAIAPRVTAGSYALEVTASFAAEPDPFALRTDDAAEAAALLIQLNGREILRRTERLAGGTSLRVEPVPGIVEGVNEIYIEAYPPLTEASMSHAARVRLLRGEQRIAEETLWGEEGGRIAGTFRFEIEAMATATEDDGHGH